MESGDLRVIWRAPGELAPWAANPRTHSEEQVGRIARSIQAFGFTNPILVDEAGRILAGHGRLAAAARLGVDAVRIQSDGGAARATPLFQPYSKNTWWVKSRPFEIVIWV
jgi:hypothetical protein